MKALRTTLILISAALACAWPASAQIIPGTPAAPVACSPGQVCPCPTTGDIAGCVAATMVVCQAASGTPTAAIDTTRGVVVGGSVECVVQRPSAVPTEPRCVKGELCSCRGDLNNNGPASIYACVAQSLATCVGTGGTPQGGGTIHDPLNPGSGEFFFFCI